MTRSRSALVDALAQELTPTPRPGRTALAAVLWLAASWVFVVAATLALGPLRPDLGEQLATHPRFLAESLLGIAVGAVGIATALRLGIPEPRHGWRRVGPAALLLALWIAFYFYGLWDPALAPSMLGKREECWLQTLLFGGPPLVAGLWWLRRLAPIDRVAAGAVLGATAGALPGLLMQLACMYVPDHILAAHVAPLFGLAALGAILGPVMLRRL